LDLDALLDLFCQRLRPLEGVQQHPRPDQLVRRTLQQEQVGALLLDQGTAHLVFGVERPLGHELLFVLEQGVDGGRNPVVQEPAELGLVEVLVVSEALHLGPQVHTGDFSLRACTLQTAVLHVGTEVDCAVLEHAPPEVVPKFGAAFCFSAAEALTVAPALHDGHEVLSEGACLVRADAVRVAHGLTAVDLLDQVVVVHHLAHALGQRDGHRQRQPLRNGANHHRDAHNDAVQLLEGDDKAVVHVCFMLGKNLNGDLDPDDEDD